MCEFLGHVGATQRARRHFRSVPDQVFGILSVGTPLCPLGIASRGGYGILITEFITEDSPF